jgi:hypothetical protein
MSIDIPRSHFLQLSVQYSQKSLKKVKENAKTLSPLLEEIKDITKILKIRNIRIDDISVSENEEAKVYRERIDALMGKIEPYKTFHEQCSRLTHKFNIMAQETEGQSFVRVSEQESLILLDMENLFS